jgi:hypothetical protein
VRTLRQRQVPVFKGLFWISTKSVDNDVENRPLDSPEATSGARFNKLPVARADVGARKISDLRTPFRPPGKKKAVLKKGNSCA